MQTVNKIAIAATLIAIVAMIAFSPPTMATATDNHANQISLAVTVVPPAVVVADLVHRFNPSATNGTIEQEAYYLATFASVAARVDGVKQDRQEQLLCYEQSGAGAVARSTSS